MTENDPHMARIYELVSLAIAIIGVAILAAVWFCGG
jgi:hypothetical protein